MNKDISAPIWIGWFCITIALLVQIPLSAKIIDKSPDAFPHVRFTHLYSVGETMLSGVYFIYQDHSGYMWLADDTGLMRYDGYTVRQFNHDPNDDTTISNNFISGITMDRQNRLWVITNKGLNLFNPRDNTFTRYYNGDENDPGSALQNRLRAITQLSDDTILVGSVGKGIFSFDPKTGTYTPFTYTLDNNKTHADVRYIRHLLEDSQRTLWIATDKQGAVAVPLDNTTENTRPSYQYHHSSPPAQKVAAGNARSFAEDRDGNIWFGSDNGLYKINRDRTVGKHISRGTPGTQSLQSNFVRSLVFDRNHDLWIGTDGGGISLYKPNEDAMQTYLHSPGDPTSLNSNVVRSIFEDQIGSIWIGSYPLGLNIFHRSTENIAVIQHNPNEPNQLSHSSVFGILEDDDKNLWIGTDGGGLNYYNMQTGTFTHYQAPQGNHATDANHICGNAVLSLAKQEHSLWIGTWGGSLCRLDLRTRKFSHYPSIADNERTPSHKNIWALYFDSVGRLWIGTEGGGVNLYHPETDDFTRIPFNKSPNTSLQSRIAWAFLEDEKGYLWIGAGNGGLSRYDPISKEFIHFNHQNNDPNSLADDSIYVLRKAPGGKIWVGTRDGLDLFDPQTHIFTHINDNDKSLSNKVVYSIQEDDSGGIWIGTNKGLFRYNPDKQHLRRFNQEYWGNTKFNFGASYKDSDGYVILGSATGLVHFQPERLKANTLPPPIVLTDLKVFNESIQPNDNTNILTRALNYTDDLQFSHKQNMFSFEFSALNFYDTDNNQYRYKLEGFDEQWNNIGNERKAIYTNLDAGHYTLHITGSNNDGLWNTEGKKINIRVLPAPWRTWWAYSLYILLFAGSIFSYIYIQQKQIRHERILNARLRDLDELKDDFLANTSHELRTPLNGIIGLSDCLLSGIGGDLSDIARKNLEMISISGRRLAHLVNDILDISKLKKNTITIYPKNVSLKEAIDVIIGLNEITLNGKAIEIRNTVNGDVYVWADENRLQQILQNLIGNAIKFTEKGNITFSAEQSDERLWISVQDTGIGIPEEKLDTIFNSFSQVENHVQRHHSGTGLGLTITEKLVSLHGGTIRVESTPDKGSTFSFSIPIAHADTSTTASTTEAICDIQEEPRSFAHNYIASSPATNPRLKEKKSIQDTATNEPQPIEKSISPDHSDTQGNRNSSYRILVVDDEEVNLQVISNQLELLHYQFDTAKSGFEALEKFEGGLQYDLILLDIMMPGMSGYEVCNTLRDKYPIHQLPIIFLTAKSQATDLTNGFNVGANDYLTKPITLSELTSRVNTHLTLLETNRRMSYVIKQEQYERDKAHAVLLTLDGIINNLNNEITFIELMDVFVDQAHQLFPNADTLFYWVPDDSKETLTGSTPSPFNIEHLPEKSIKTTSFLSTLKSFASNVSAGVYIFNEEASLDESRKIIGETVQSAIVVCMYFDEEISCALVIASKQSAFAFKNIDIDTLQRFYAHSLSAQSKVLLLNKLNEQEERLQETRLTDHVTGYRNRNYLSQFIDNDTKLITRAYETSNLHDRELQNSDISFILLEIDHFHTIKNKHGIKASEQLLKQFSRATRSIFRETDYSIRWSENTFLFVIRFANRSNTHDIAERLRSIVEDSAFTVNNGREIRTTCSQGFTHFPFYTHAPKAFNWEQSIDIANMCLKAAKDAQLNSWIGLEAAPHSHTLTALELAGHINDHLKLNNLQLSTNIQNTENIPWHRPGTS